ncbi:site-2 protease family protein [Jeotgalibacillus proteolyticus]|uniref:Site-2 protease family protein n=1 Tax=Jeotgalibacillus proteolyticus TaxID=2082395 RepID=A0A2S5G9T6_9BACL|nr:site-2 protease family protein [Jeotgalibacillus proteolyticus]PPA69685.1 site-2 protease family protein [Jeotgalibacillus proteolyticus]
MFSLFNNPEQLVYIIITLLIAFTLHEFAHAYVAYKFGDPTAKNQGRLTFNPIKHLDPIGTILIFIIGFGWAKPVPVNRFYFKNPRLAGVLVSLAGPLTNLVLAFIAQTAYIALVIAGIQVPLFLTGLLMTMISLNILLFVFNLIPLPPLDGYRIISDLVPNRIRPKLTQYEQYGGLLFLVIAITPLSNYTITPLFNTTIPAIQQFFGVIIGTLFGL